MDDHHPSLETPVKPRRQPPATLDKDKLYAAIRHLRRLGATVHRPGELHHVTDGKGKRLLTDAQIVRLSRRLPKMIGGRPMSCRQGEHPQSDSKR